MLSNNHQASCAFGEQIVSYIYGETSAKGKKNFETHLPNCSTCADEIAGFGLVRSSINDWRKEEFFTLESPTLRIPAWRSTNLAQSTVVSGKTNSRIDELRKLLSFSPAWAAVFAAFIICAGLVWLFSSSLKNELAVNKSIEIPKVVENNPASNPKQNITQNPPDEKITDVPKTIEAKSTNQRNQNYNAAKTSPKSKSVAPKMNNTLAENKPATNKKSNNVQKSEVPTLLNIKEEEDKSLRLAELFEEIDTK